MLKSLGQSVRLRLENVNPWTNVYGLARSLIALAQIVTLAFNEPTVLFRPIAGIPVGTPFCTDKIQKFGVFCLGSGHLGLARWGCVAILLVIASGWRPRVTAIAHWWLAASYQLSASTLEGGDQAAAVLTLLLLPIALTDRRRWHWTATDVSDARERPLSTLIAAFGIMAVRLQVAGIYFHAGFGKLRVTEWVDGTAMYYWLLNPTFGVAEGLRPLAISVLQNSYVVSIISWSSIAIELFLFTGIFATRPVRRILLAAGLIFHLGIMVMMGLGTFSMVMWAALILYLRPFDEPFRFPQWSWAEWSGKKLARAPKTDSIAVAVQV